MAVHRREFLTLLGAAALAGCSSTSSDAVDAKTDSASSSDATGSDANGSDAGSSDASSDAMSDAKAVDPSRLRVLNYNVMCSFCKNEDHSDWVHDWKARVPWLSDVVQRYDPDLIGLQELSAIGLEAGTPDEASQILGTDTWGVYYYRTKPGDAFEFDYPDAILAWRKSRFDLLEKGEFWLSPTPDTAYSIGFAKGMQFPRLVVWARLKDKASGREFAFANTHFDNNTPSQDLSAPLSLERLAPLAAKGPVIFCGDFNSTPSSTAFAKLTGGAPKLLDTYAQAPKKTQESNATPTPEWKEPERIDHVYVTAPLQAEKWSIDLWRYGAKSQAPSDHPGAVVVDLVWPV